jgi:hypothetical protein
MQKSTLVSIIIALGCLGASITGFAATVRINNTLANDPARKIYAGLQAAHDDGTNVGAGDTLLVEGTPLEYEGLTCTKRLVIIGPGYLLTQNPQSQANSQSARVRAIDFNAGSEGSVIIGLTFSNNSSLYGPSIRVNNIAVMRCYLTNGIKINASISNLVVVQNYLEKYGIDVNSSLYSFGGVILRNNIIASPIAITQYTDAPRIFAAVEHNVFLGNVTVSANAFRNNIIAGKAATVAVTSGAIQNNLVSNNQLPPTDGNQTYNETALFAGLAGAGNSTDGQYQLKPDSPYRAAGLNGVEPGAFGGSEPYVLSGVPAIPTIYDLQGESVGSKQNGLNVTIKARTNQ